jgi:uncharacterized protein (TIGR00369 family)
MSAAAVPEGFAPHPIGGEFVALTGPFFIRRLAPERIELGFRVEPRHCNLMGNCHGGMLATFCDMLLPITVHQTVAQVGLRFLPTIGLQMDYLAPTPLGAWVQSEAQVLRITRSMVFAHAVVTADGTPVARCSGTMKIGPPIPGTLDAAL